MGAISILKLMLIALVCFAFGLASGFLAGDYRGQKAAATAALKATQKQNALIRSVEQTAAANLADAEAAYQSKIKERDARHDVELSLLRRSLESVRACTVPDDAVRLLNPEPGAVRVSSVSTATARLGDTSAPPDTSCAGQLEIAARNYREVCEPNADQLDAVLKLYEQQRATFNRRK